MFRPGWLLHPRLSRVAKQPGKLVRVEGLLHPPLADVAKHPGKLVSAGHETRRKVSAAALD
jgi:hypothetical protein